jgi:hypothetical protein
VNVGDEVLLLLLKRVHDGHITEYCGQYFDDGERIRYWAAEKALQTLAEVGPRLELTYPPDSGVWRAKDYGHGELVKGVHVGLTKAETTRRVTLSERGAGEYKALRERQQGALLA